ncbi:MAG: hypothetical protein IRZ11_05055 [Clostridia bacterium]|nr:hypothetical protein [Clostridia bacterium]
MRKEVPMVLTVLAGLFVIVAKYLHAVDQLGWFTVGNRWFQIVYAMFFLLGVVSLTIVHGKNVQRRRSKWVYSLILLICMYGYGILTLEQTVDGPEANWIYNNIIVPSDSTVFALLAFFITSAAYRAFRIRTREATVLMITSVILMMGTAPIGDTIIPGWGTLAHWLMDVPNSSAMRGIQIGAYLGGFAVALRILFGLERAHLGGAS